MYDEAVEKLCSFIVDGVAGSSDSKELHIAELAAQNKQAVIVDACTLTGESMADVGVSALAVPLLKSDGTLMGVAEMVNKTNGCFTSGDKRMVTCFAGFAATSPMSVGRS